MPAGMEEGQGVVPAELLISDIFAQQVRGVKSHDHATPRVWGCCYHLLVVPAATLEALRAQSSVACVTGTATVAMPRHSEPPTPRAPCHYPFTADSVRRGCRGQQPLTGNPNPPSLHLPRQHRAAQQSSPIQKIDLCRSSVDDKAVAVLVKSFGATKLRG